MRLLKIPVLCGFDAAARGGDAPPLFSASEIFRALFLHFLECFRTVFVI